MLPFAGSIFPARRLWLKALTRCESPASLLAAAQARRATHTGPSSSKGPKSSSPPNRRRRRRLPESAREVLEARLDARHLTPEHVEAMRHLSSVFSDEDPNKLHVRPDGFVPVSRVLQHPLMANISFKTLDDIVRWDKKRRFQLIYKPMTLSPCSEGWWMRVRRGTSENEIRDLFLRPVHDASQVPLAIHVTTPEIWEKTTSRTGLLRENEPYLHLSKSIPGREPIFGKRPIVLKKPLHPELLISRRPLPEIRREHIAKVFVYVDVAKAMAAGIPFFISKRQTIATPGDEYGVLAPELFRRVDLVNIRMRRVIGELDRVTEEKHLEAQALQESGLSMTEHAEKVKKRRKVAKIRERRRLKRREVAWEKKLAREAATRTTATTEEPPLKTEVES